jgi:hypothetical protein
MDLFQAFPDEFNFALWEQRQKMLLVSSDIEFGETDPAIEVLSFGDEGYDPKLFFIFQVADKSGHRILMSSEVEPALNVKDTNPDINLWIDIDSFKLSPEEGIDPTTKATLQLVVGQEQKMDTLDKLFYCINGGLDLYDQLNSKYSKASDFKKATGEALGNKPISLPGGIGSISLKIIKHQDPPLWKRVFDFAKTDKAKELISLIGFGGITDTALKTIGGLMDNVFTHLDKEPEILFKSSSLKAAFSKRGKKLLNGGLSINYVSSLNSGIWLMAKLADYQKIKNLNPIYYSGSGMLAPDGFTEFQALSAKDNPFFNITYIILNVRMKEVNLKQNFI